jgi:hypothetical protein
MSWRLLLTSLLVALGMATWGGIQLGDWLVAHAPRATPAPGQESDLFQQPVLDANGRPYVAQPPQPRIDGTLGVPDKPADTQWPVPMVSLFDTVTDPTVQISRDGISIDKVPETAANSPGPGVLLTGPSDIPTLDLQTTKGPSSAVQSGQEQTSSRPARALTAQTPMRAPLSATAPPAGAKGWQEALKRELENCAKQGFFERPSCSWNARNRYCEPNQAWGTIAECPHKDGG